MNSEPLRLCRDCRHCDLGKKSTPPLEWPQGRALHWWCHVDSREVDPVSGNFINQSPTHCHEMRQNTRCGISAKLFQPRLSP
jgi:hypothetical protein